jgi:eukaryotic-like serine/threonine-protein kinase
MTVGVGSKFGPYEILAPIGAGGMGEVWKARDTRLDRSVAIKFSQEQFSERFEREAKAIAQLNHPHICTLHDIGANYLVMEFVDGETLQARLKKGPIPVDQATRYGAQIAGGLAAAHSAGIVHRDLKPANIILTKSGAKILDFGLARLETDQTITIANTVLGTPAYMAPEQRNGLPADTRSDIYALGLVLRETITGRRDAALTAPPYLASIIDRCLQEAPEDRWQSAADVQRLLEWSPPQPPPARSKLPWVVAIFALVFLTADLAWYRARRSPANSPAEFLIALDREDGSLPVPSPDGRLLAFRGLDANGHFVIWLRPVNSLTSQPVSGTEGASSTIFWSPAGDWIGFHAAGALKKIRTAGGLPVTITEISDLQDAAWNDQGDIIFRRSNREPLKRVRDSGGAPQPLTKFNEALLENSHRFPVFLPGGRQFLFVTRCADRANDALYVGSLDNREIKRVMFAEARVAYTNGSLIYYRDGALVAQVFDSRHAQVSGDPRVIVNKISYNAPSILASFNVSNDGSVIVFDAADKLTSRLVWFDRVGRELGVVGSPGQYHQPRISPSGDRVVFQMPDPKTGNRDLAFIEVGRNIIHRLTNNPANDWYPVWSPDGRQVAFGSDRIDGRTMFAFLKTSLDQSAPETRIEGFEQPTDWSKEGWIASGYGKIGVLSVKTGKSVNLTTSTGREWAARFSPDSKWLAYSSDESGRSEIYVRAFPGHPDPSATKIQISDNGGQFPLWNDAGTELYYASSGDVVFAVDTRALAAGKVSAPVRLFKVCSQSQPSTRAMGGGPYTPPLDTRDGKKFLASCLVEPTGQYTVLMNWAGGAR